MNIVFNTNKKLKGFWGIQDATNQGVDKPNIGTIKKQTNQPISDTESGTLYVLSFKFHLFLHPRQKEHRVIKMLASAKRGEYTTN